MQLKNEYPQHDSDFLSTCRFLTDCEQILGDGCHTCAFTLGTALDEDSESIVAAPAPADHSPQTS